jgi:peptidoglycan/LPS O-acetylase OafA/YrhL
MFGTYRFILAALVALSHFGIRAAGFNPGQWAVICFYTLSGLLMERQFQKLSQKGNGTKAFYLDRFLRIYPLFLIALLFAWAGNTLSWEGALANIMLLPLNYTFFTGFPMLIAPSWSLACESHFYLLVPLLVLCSTKVLRLILCASLCFFMITPWLPNSTFWAYIGLPGIFFTFLSGILINRKEIVFVKVIWVIMLFLLIAFGLTKCFHTGLPTGIHINIAIGYLIAIIATILLDKFSPDAKWDKSLGLVSYPLFLCHGVVAEFLEQHWQIYKPFELLFASILFAILLILVIEIPFDTIRYRLRALVANAK